MTTWRALLLSDFNIGNLASSLRGTLDEPRVEPVVAPHGEVIEHLLDPDRPAWSSDPDAVIVWSRPEGVIESFRSLTRHGGGTLEGCLAEVDEYTDRILACASRVRLTLVPIWARSPSSRGLGVMDLSDQGGHANALLRMNLRLVDRLGPCESIGLLDTPRWGAEHESAFRGKLWYGGKIPFVDDVFREAALDIKAALRAREGRARKLLVVDLDDTLWGGVVGEVGWQDLRLGGHDHRGEAFADFQAELAALARRGILLAIISKNDESTAMNAIERHPEMILRRRDFAGWRINWHDKADNLASLLDELDLLPESAVFVDDSPGERDRVRSALPGVLVPEWPRDPTAFCQALAGLRAFDVIATTAEDRARATHYADERERRERLKSASSVQEWLEQLALVARIERLAAHDYVRARQLLNKTNQMNLTTRRLLGNELDEWLRADHHAMWTLRVSDKFGDSGLVGLISTAFDGPRGTVVDFVVSCRVLGRRIEDVMLHTAISELRERGADEVTLAFRATGRNRPMAEYLASTPLANRGGGVFVWASERGDYPLPDFIEIERAERDAT